LISLMCRFGRSFGRMQDVTNLIIWHRAVKLAADVGNAIPFDAGKRAPGLRAQIMRAADGISLALAEGCGKNSDWELARYSEISAGSVTELQTQLVLAHKHGVLERGKLKAFWRECIEQRKMLHAFQKKVRERAARKDREAKDRRDRPQP
jgi:four helix bundle protein